MEPEKTPSLPHAHQQVRLGESQACAHKWSVAIESYLRAIEYFNAIQQTLVDDSLIANLQAQKVQCEKAIDFCRLKDRSEQASKAQCSSKLSRAHSTSSVKTLTDSNRTMSRHNTLHSENPGRSSGHARRDSFTEAMFPKENQIVQTPVKAKKNKKNDSHKIEELQMSYDAAKNNLKFAYDQIERLEQEKKQLQMQRNEPLRSLATSREECKLETELEATI